MGRFIVKLLLYLSPLILLLGYYFYKDPFKVLFHYDTYYPVLDTSYFELDDDYVTTQTFIQNYPKYHYDSYILGSSRSDNYFVNEFGKHVHSNKCYHLDAAYESLYGLERKMNFLNERKYKIDNVLIILDNELLAKVKNDAGHITIMHPLLSGQNVLAFQLEFLKDFFDKDFLFAYLDLNFTGHLKPSAITKQVLGRITFHYDVSANEFYWAGLEKEIANNNYYNTREHIFYKRDSMLHYTKPVVGAEQKKLLYNIKAILDGNLAKYKIVISPLYNQLKFDTTDLKTLQSIFTSGQVYDFSGINDLTGDISNYYETSHYRPKACAEIMNRIYEN